MSDQLRGTKTQQPDATPPPPPPSILLYGTIAVASSLMALFAFLLMGKADWGALLLNVSAGLVSALVVLIFVERRIRQSELSAIQQAPIKARMSIVTLFSPSARAAKKYSEAYIAAVDKITTHVIYRDFFVKHESTLVSGCNLLSEPGMGKTTWLQLVASKFCQQFLSTAGGTKIIVLFPLIKWPRSLSLEEALIAHIRSYAGCTDYAARGCLKKKTATIFFDGYDDIFMQQRGLNNSLRAFREKFTGIPISVASRSNYPTPMSDYQILKIPPLNAEEQRQLENEGFIRPRRIES